MFGLALWGHIENKKKQQTTTSVQGSATVKPMKMKEQQLHYVLQMNNKYSWPNAGTPSLHTFTNTDALLNNIAAYIYDNEPSMMLM